MLEYLHSIQGYAYFFSTLVMVVGLYYYIWYLYKGKERGQDYEKYSNLALNDELTDEIIDERDPLVEDDASVNTAEGKDK